MKVTTTHKIDADHLDAIEIEVTCSVTIGAPKTRCHPGDSDEVFIKSVAVDGEIVDGAAKRLAIALAGIEEIEEAAVDMALGDITETKAIHAVYQEIR